MKIIGMILEDDLDDHQQKLVDDKRQEYETRNQPDSGDSSITGFPAEARLCSKCQTKAVVLLDGCMTCLNCGDSKCGWTLFHNTSERSSTQTRFIIKPRTTIFFASTIAT